MASRDPYEICKQLMRRVAALERRLNGLASRGGVDIWEEEFSVDVELAGSLSPGGSVSCKVMKWTGSAEGDSGQTLTAYDRYGLTGVMGMKGRATWKPPKQRFDLENLSC